jgi:hypothetical protein
MQPSEPPEYALRDHPGGRTAERWGNIPVQMRIQLWDDLAGVACADIDVDVLPRRGDVVAVRYRGNAPSGNPPSTLHFHVENAVFHADDCGKAPNAPVETKIVIHGRVWIVAR